MKQKPRSQAPYGIRFMEGDASDEALVRRALAGSDHAWTKLVGRYQRRVYNYALRMIGHPDDALDLMQEVFVGVLRNLPGYRGDGAFAAWLFRIAAYRCTDYLRRRRVAVSLDEAAWDGVDGAATDAASRADANQPITRALAGLPAEQRHVVELKSGGTPMKTLLFFAVALAVGAQAREPENLAALLDEMAVLERVLGAALESETSGSTGYRSGLEVIQDQTGINLRPWLQRSVSSIEAEYLAWQGILVSLQLRREPSVRDLPDALFITMARTGETRLPMILSSLESGEFAELKKLVDQLAEERKSYGDLTRDWHLELRESGLDPQESGDPIVQAIGAVQARERELNAAIDAEIKRLRGVVEPQQEPSTNDIHGALVQAVCDYAMLKSLPDDEHLTLKVSQERAHLPRRGLEWTYYVLAKKDVVECRQGSIDAAQLRQRAFVYSNTRTK